MRTLDEDDGELPAGPAHLLVTPEMYAQVHAGPPSRIWTEAESKEFEGLLAVGTFVEEVFPLEVCYHNSNGNSSSRSSNDTTSNHDLWWGATCVGALLRPFDPGKQCRRSTRRVKKVPGLDLPFDRGRAWRRMQHGG